ncbi:MAG: alpha/beta hydrolase [Muribaculaceae bacterium]|nr:alpha/beta hydrolase [Muribaculaceae bacterium]
MKTVFLTLMLATAITVSASINENITMNSNENTASIEKLNLTHEWDKTFPKSDKVSHSKVTFTNRYGTTLAADLYIPMNASGKLPAIAVSGPFGAVKEQVSGRYAQKMAERGYLAIAFDPSYTGESGGSPRNVASPDINTEDFSAAVDYLMTRNDVDHDKIGIIGICGWGGFAINAAANDPRIKATVASTMYDMSRVSANGYFDASTAEQRKELRAKLAEQRTADARNGYYACGGGVIDPLPDDAPQFVRDYYDYYKTERGYHPRSLNSNNGFNATSPLPFLNMPLLTYADEIDNAVMLVHGEKAHSLYFSEDAYRRLIENHKPGTANNKVFHVVPGANHTDLYDRTDIIPFDDIEHLFYETL